VSSGVRWQSVDYLPILSSRVRVYIDLDTDPLLRKLYYTPIRHYFQSMLLLHVHVDVYVRRTLHVALQLRPIVRSNEPRSRRSPMPRLSKELD
jgi:hypothetical protein